MYRRSNKDREKVKFTIQHVFKFVFFGRADFKNIFNKSWQFFLAFLHYKYSLVRLTL